jgi:glucosamine 6-phosphate synthetase-like amidotransferase/phosphosugar isomerase protein
MKRIALIFIFAWSVASAAQAQGNWSFKGTVTRMRMTDCVMHTGFMATMSGVPAPAGITCPEYTLMSDKVVYVVVGRRTDEFIPLAENMVFLIRKNEIVLFSDDEKTKSRFSIQRMMLRADWDREEERKELAAAIMERSVNYEARNPPRTSMPPTSGR